MCPSPVPLATIKLDTVTSIETVVVPGANILPSVGEVIMIEGSVGAVYIGFTAPKVPARAGAVLKFAAKTVFAEIS